MKLRVLIAGILGGIVLFNWGFVAHMVLPIGMMGIITAPNEPVLRNHLREHLPEPGVYMIPGMPAKPTPEQTKKHDEDYKTGPNGLLFVDPSGGDPSLPPHLIKEVVANILSALLAAALLACVNVKYFARVVFVTALGGFAWLVAWVPYWNWYSFSLEFTIARAVELIVGWLLAGLVIGAIVKHAPKVEKTEV